MRSKHTMLLICLVLITHIKSFSKVDSIRIQNLETKVGEIGDRKLKYIDEDLERIQKKLKEAEETIEKHDDLYQNCILFLSFLSTLGIGGWLWIKDKAKEKVEEVIKDQSTTLSKLFNDVRTEREIKENTKILIFTKDGTEHDQLKLLLQNNKFSNISFKRFDSSAEISPNIFNLIIFVDIYDKNQQNQEFIDFTENKISDVVRRYGDGIKYFYFGSGRLNMSLINSFEYKISSSNFPSQIIGNIMNLLKYN